MNSAIYRFRKPLILFLILLFPSLLYIVLSTGKHKFEKLPIFGDRLVSEDGDTLYHTVQPFLFQNFSDQDVSLADFNGKVKLFSIVCAACGHGDSRIKSELAQIDLQFEKFNDLVFITFISNYDNHKEVQKLMDIPEVTENRWTFLKADSGLLKNFATQSLLISAYDEEKASNHLVLVDSRNQIRGIYNGTVYLEVKELIDAIKALRKEEFLVKNEIKK